MEKSLSELIFFDLTQNMTLKDAIEFVESQRRQDQSHMPREFWIKLINKLFIEKIRIMQSSITFLWINSRSDVVTNEEWYKHSLALAYSVEYKLLLADHAKNVGPFNVTGYTGNYDDIDFSKYMCLTGHGLKPKPNTTGVLAQLDLTIKGNWIGSFYHISWNDLNNTNLTEMCAENITHPIKLYYVNKLTRISLMVDNVTDPTNIPFDAPDKKEFVRGIVKQYIMEMTFDVENVITIESSVESFTPYVIKLKFRRVIYR